MYRVLKRLRIDPFLLLLLLTVALATVLPVRGRAADIAGTITNLAIALLFFLHGAKLSREAIRRGIGAWRVHIAVLALGFILFPILGLIAVRLLGSTIDPALASGLLFLCLLPSTVQSSIAFTSIAHGDVPSAVCSASLSNLIGIFLTPLLVALLMHANHVSVSPNAVEKIALQLLLPFVAGHLSRPLIGGFIDRHKTLVGRVDRSSILLVVYTAFSASVVQGLWQSIALRDLAIVLVANCAILGIMLMASLYTARAMGLAKPFQIVVLFCGSKKSLASGVPMASTLFPAAMLGPTVLPLMLFHQIQLMACATIAQRYAAAGAEPASPANGTSAPAGAA
jgi:solute carrier family 10 (sodium/bile acid cotransporter), member 7